MKRAWLLVLVLWSSTVMAQGLSLVLTAFKMLSEEKIEVFYAKVQTQGRDFEDARTRAFRLAVEQAVGSVVLSETEIRNQQITRDEIVSYSSGFVDRYNILSRQDLGNRVEIIAEVWVAHSAIANRLLARNAAETSVNGAGLALQFGSIMQERVSGDRLLTTVLNDHPRRSMTTKLHRPQISIGNNRELVVTVNWEVHWSDHYRRSLEDTVKHFAKKTCWSGDKQTSCFMLLGHKVDDEQKAWMIYRKLAHTELAVSISAVDDQGRNIVQSCVWPNIDGIMIATRPGVVFMPNAYFSGTQRFYFANNPEVLQKLHNFKGEVVERSKCQG